MKIEIGNKEYTVIVAESEEDKAKGLQGKDELKDDEGMLFIYDPPQTVGFWMKDTPIPLDIIFIDEDGEVISIYQGEPFTEDIAKEYNVKYVLEINQNSGIEEGDELDIDDDDDDTHSMQVLAPDGSVQMDLDGGERIVSRRETLILIKKAKTAERVRQDPINFDEKCKILGNYFFKVLKKQDSREPEYVNSPK